MFIKKDLKKNVLISIIVSSVSLAYILLMYFLTKWSLSDIFILPAVLPLSYLVLRWVTRFGIFDVFSYQIINWTSSWKKGSPKKYNDAFEYKTHMKEQRENHHMTWMPYLVIGGIFLVLCIVFSFFPQIGR